MNNGTALIAILELKGILTREEGEKIVEFINNKPQPTLLADAVEQVKDLVSELAPLVKDVERTAKATVKKVTDKAIESVEAIRTETEHIAEDVAKAAEVVSAKANTKTPTKK